MGIFVLEVTHTCLCGHHLGNVGLDPSRSLSPRSLIARGRKHKHAILYTLHQQISESIGVSHPLISKKGSPLKMKVPGPHPAPGRDIVSRKLAIRTEYYNEYAHVSVCVHLCVICNTCVMYTCACYVCPYI